MKQPSLSKQDLAWRAQDDAHALASAEAIKNDPKRHKAAATAAQKMAKDAQDHAQSMKTVANKAPKAFSKSQEKRVSSQTKSSTGRKK